tara:strand:- start:1041 stop:1283 length:243 start_codon:yes stop_codon:yes gene_type:complete
MLDSEIRASLHYAVYIDHCKSLKIAGDENAALFFENKLKRLNSDNHRIKLLGLFRSTMILYAVSTELIIKARALFENEKK